jgi:hypothetical protein
MDFLIATALVTAWCIGAPALFLLSLAGNKAD